MDDPICLLLRGEDGRQRGQHGMSHRSKRYRTVTDELSDEGGDVEEWTAQPDGSFRRVFEADDSDLPALKRVKDGLKDLELRGPSSPSGGPVPMPPRPQQHIWERRTPVPPQQGVPDVAMGDPDRPVQPNTNAPT